MPKNKEAYCFCLSKDRLEDLAACLCLLKTVWRTCQPALACPRTYGSSPQRQVKFPKFSSTLFTICRCGENSALAAAGSTNTKDCMEGLTTCYGLAKDCAENLPVCFYLPKSCKEDLAACFCLPKDCTEDLAACSGP